MQKKAQCGHSALILCAKHSALAVYRSLYGLNKASMPRICINDFFEDKLLEDLFQHGYNSTIIQHENVVNEIHKQQFIWILEGNGFVFTIDQCNYFFAKMISLYANAKSRSSKRIKLIWVQRGQADECAL